MSAKVKKALKELQDAVCAEDVFGDLKGNLNDSLKEAYREWAKNTHADLCSDEDKPLAHEAFILLNKFLKEAEEKIKNGSYGERQTVVSDVVITTRKSSYSLSRLVASGDICDVYIASRGHSHGAEEVALKVSREPLYNSLVLNESTALSEIRKTSEGLKVLQHVPELVESFQAKDGVVLKQCNALKPLTGYVSLADIINAYPEGVDPRDAAWMFNRLLAALIVAHKADWVHGAVVPPHIFLNLSDHNGVLIDWCYAVKKGQVLSHICPHCELYYPKEVFQKVPTSFGLDLYMAAICLKMLLGRQIVPHQISGLINACRLGPKHRAQDAFELYEDFGKVLNQLYGKRKFRPFSMPITK